MEKYVPLVNGVKVISWSTNCPHCMRSKVKSRLGLSLSTMIALLTDLADGNKVCWSWECMVPGSTTANAPLGVETPIHYSLGIKMNHQLAD